METRTEVAKGVSAPAEARRFVAASLSERIPEPVLDDAMLLASELVTNAYQHAGSPEGFPIEVSVALTEDRLRLEMVDHRIFYLTAETNGELEDLRLELPLIDRIAQDWGRISRGGIWVELRLKQA